MTKSDTKQSTMGGKKTAKSTTKSKSASSSQAKPSSKFEASKGTGSGRVSKSKKNGASELKPIIVKHEPIVPEGLPKKYFLKSTFNTHDIMHAPVEKTIKMLDKILAGERLFTM